MEVQLVSFANSSHTLVACLPPLETVPRDEPIPATPASGPARLGLVEALLLAAGLAAYDM